MEQLESILIVTRKTALEELVARFNSRSQAKFYIEQTARQNPHVKSIPFEEYQNAHDTYHQSLGSLKDRLPKGIKNQIIDRDFLPSFQFSGKDLVITLGPDGLVINTAKYLTNEPILALNPDPARIDGVLIPFHMYSAEEVIGIAFQGQARIKPVSMAKAKLSDGQALYAVNDLFIGARTHVSARYRLELDGKFEDQSSSGIIISTGAGSTGWLRSIVTGSYQVVGHFASGGTKIPGNNIYRLDWSSPQLVFAVREPFPSLTSTTGITFGWLGEGKNLVITSFMSGNGVIFSDGIEADFLQFNSGTIATISLAERSANLIVP